MSKTTHISGDLAIAELADYLDATYNAYVDSKSRQGAALHMRAARWIFVLVATRKLRPLARRAKRLKAGNSDPEALTKLLEDVFMERRVLRSPVPLLPDYPNLSHAAKIHGENILATRTDKSDRSVGAVLQLCANPPSKLAQVFDKPEIRAAIPTRILDLIGIDELDSRDLLEPPRDLGDTERGCRIAYVAAMTLPYRTNGYSSRTEGIALAYAGNGIPVSVVSKPGFPLNLMSSKEQDQVRETEALNGVTYHRVLSPQWTSRNYTAYARKAADALEDKFRQLEASYVVAASDYRNSLPAMIAARRLGLPFTYEVRGMWELTWASDNPGYENTRKFAVAQEVEAFVCRNADTVLTLTQGMKNSLVDRGVDEEKIALMPNGVSPEMLEMHPRDDALAAALGLAPGTVVIGYAGAFKEYEGLPDLANAVAQLAERGLNVTLLIVGAEKADTFGSAPITDAIKQAFDRVGRPDRLLMTGRVPFKDMPRYYSIMDICPITRRAYTVAELVSPIKPVEAMAQQKAVVLSDVEALKFFAQNETTALMFRKGDVNHLAEKLSLLVENPELRQDLGKRGRHFVETDLQWSNICKRAAEHMGITPAD